VLLGGVAGAVAAADAAVGFATVGVVGVVGVVVAVPVLVVPAHIQIFRVYLFAGSAFIFSKNLLQYRCAGADT
jgi:hypothetical protein